MQLFLWNVLNCIFGTFPFVFNQENNQTKLKPCLVWTPLSLICLLSSGWMLFTTCQFYSTSVSQPEKFHCYLFWLGNIAMILHRFVAVKPTRNLFSEIVSNYPLNYFFNTSLKLITFQLLIAIAKTFIFVFTIRTAMLVHFEISISFFYTLLPCFINMQSIMICVVLSERMTQLENKFSECSKKPNHVGQAIRSLKSELTFCYKTFKKFLNVYTVDIFIAVSVSFLGACVIFNIVIAITLRFVYWNHYSFPLYMSKMVFFTFHFMGYFLHVIWLSGNASLLKKRVRKLQNNCF